MKNNTAHPAPSYGFYFAIWVALIALLVGGTSISSLPISKTGIAALILLVSTVKAVLVALFYMHLKGERLPLWVVVIFPFLLIGLALLLVLIGAVTS